MLDALNTWRNDVTGESGQWLDFRAPGGRLVRLLRDSRTLGNRWRATAELAPAGADPATVEHRGRAGKGWAHLRDAREAARRRFGKAAGR